MVCFTAQFGFTRCFEKGEALSDASGHINNYKIEQKLHNVINLFENLQNQVDGIKISD